MRRSLAVLLVFAAVPLFAQTTHEVSKIQFQSRIPARILLSQSMLQADHTYSDQDLELAMSRLRRLPFVYNATYQLDGSNLIVMVIDQYHVFYDFDAMLAKETVRGGSSGEGFLNTEIGGRLYTPWGGTVQGSWGLQTQSHLHSTSYGGQYDQYGMFGSPAYAIVRVDRPSTGGSYVPQLTVGYPLTLRQTLLAKATTVHDTRHDGGGFGVGGATTVTKQRIVSAGWLYDTTNDPIFANRGESFLLEGGKQTQDATFDSFSNLTGKLLFHNDSKSTRTNWHGVAEKFWNRGRSAYTGSIDVTYSPGTNSFRTTATSPFTRVDASERHTVVTVGWVHNLFSSLAEVPESRGRIELLAGITNDRSKFSTHTSTITVRQIGAGWAYRNRYGAFHFVLEYMTD